MMVEQAGAVEWDGHALTGWVTINGTPIKVTADRDTIHRHAPGFSDALTWEIRNHASEIFDKLKPFFRATHA